MQKRTYLTITPETRPEALRAAGRLPNGENSLAYDESQKLWFAKAAADLGRVKAWLPENTTAGRYETKSNLSPAEEFAEVLKDAGFVFPPGELPIMDGKHHRMLTDGDNARKKSARDGSGVYQGFLDGRPAGWYQNHHASTGKVNWKSSGEFRVDPARAMQQRAMNAQRQWDRQLEQSATFDKTAAYLSRLQDSLAPATAEHPYLQRKQVPPAEGIRIDRYGNLFIPLQNLQGDIRSAEYIAADGKKTLKKDAEKMGNFFVVGGTLQPGKPVLYAEGYATAASISLASGMPVVMTVDAGNLVTVSQKLKAAYPDSPHIVLGEDDFTKADNKGRAKAREAAERIGGTWLIPVFTAGERQQALGGHASFSDFNDIHVSRGLEAVRDHLATVLDTVSPMWRVPFTQENPEMAKSPKRPDEPGLAATDTHAPAPAETPATAEPEVITVDAESASPEPAETPAEAKSDAPTLAEVQAVAEPDVPPPPEESAAMEPDVTATEPDVPTPEDDVTVAEPENIAPHAEPDAPAPADDTVVIEPEVVAPGVEPGGPEVATAMEESTLAEPVPVEPAPGEPEPTDAPTAQAAVNGFRSAFGGNVDGLPEPEKIDLDKLVQGLVRERENSTWVYSLEGERAFVHDINRGQFVMASPAACDSDRMVLAALLAARADAEAFRRGALEITGSPQFQQKVLGLIIEHNIEVKLLNPEQRDALEQMRQEKREVKDAIVTTRAPEPSGGHADTPQPATDNNQSSPAARPAPQAATPQTSAPQPATEKEQREWVNPRSGVLLEHGPAPYQFDAKNNDSYYVKLNTRNGERTYWGKELKQALADSGVTTGEAVNLRCLGKQPVTVNAPVRDDSGKILRYEKVDTERNQWEVRPTVDRNLLVARDEQAVPPSALSVYDANQFWTLQQAVIQSLGLSIATQPSGGRELLWLTPEGKGHAAPATPPDNVVVPAPSASAGSVMMQSFDSDKKLQMHLVKAQGNGEYLQGVVRQGDQYQNVLGKMCHTPEGKPYLALNTVDTTDKLTPLGHGVAVNHVRGADVHFDSMAFKLMDAPKMIATLANPEGMPKSLHKMLGFTQSYTPPKPATPPPDAPKAEHRQQAQPTMQPG
ncbi:hypothetical protein ACU60T_23500 [Klebsiella aerogenes]